MSAALAGLVLLPAVLGAGLLVTGRRADRLAGPLALTWVARTVVVLVVAGTVAAAVGRRVTDAVAEAVGPGVPSALASGAAGAVLAAVLVAVAAGMLDRSTLRDLRGADRDAQPQPPRPEVDHA